ncbi:ADP-ribosylation factor 3-like [Argonauta hians]
MGQLWTKLFRHRDVRIILLGLDAAGKTTILYRLKLGELVTTIPTIGFNVETIEYRDISLTAWDIGSRDKLRPLFRHYYKGTDAVVFVIDSADRERLDELSFDVIRPAFLAEELSSAVFLFLANKQDLPDAMTVEEITDKLSLKNLKHIWNIMPVSALTDQGLTEALDWLACQLGSVQAKKAVYSAMPPSAPEEEVPRMQRESSERLDHSMDYCTRAYTAIKCLFFRTSRTHDIAPHAHTNTHTSSPSHSRTHISSPNHSYTQTSSSSHCRTQTASPSHSFTHISSPGHSRTHTSGQSNSFTHISSPGHSRTHTSSPSHSLTHTPTASPSRTHTSIHISSPCHSRTHTPSHTQSHPQFQAHSNTESPTHSTTNTTTTTPTTPTQVAADTRTLNTQDSTSSSSSSSSSPSTPLSSSSPMIMMKATAAAAKPIVTSPLGMHPESGTLTPSPTETTAAVTMPTLASSTTETTVAAAASPTTTAAAVTEAVAASPTATVAAPASPVAAPALPGKFPHYP